jgi:dipicolinate synthase subunit A
VPALVIDRKILKRLKKGTVIIDIAQSPGGTDFDYARDLNVKAIYCPGLPGRVAPYTAAEVLKDAVINISLSHNRAL